MNQLDRLYTWGELADSPEKKFQREDNRYVVYFGEDGILLWDDEYIGENYIADIKDWKLKWRGYVE